MPLSVIKNSIGYINNEEEITYYFNKTYLEKNVKEYLGKNLQNEIKSYDISFLYFYQNEDENIKIDLTDEPKNVQIHFRCDIIQFIKYEKRFSYSLNDKEILL